MSEVTHALLGASSAHRWLNCPGSALLTADMADTTSPYAEEGTLAHSVCESYARYCLLDAGYTVVSGGTDNHSNASDEMLDCAGLYVETILEIAEPLHNPYIALEQRVDYSRWVPAGFGTADCIIIGDGTLTVIDYKHGVGNHIEEANNPQLKLYALGALERYQYLYDFSTVRWGIVQPRNGGVRFAPETFKESLLNWAEDTVKPAADLAMTPDAPLHPGDWCKTTFCKAKGSCSARSSHYLSIGDDFKEKPAKLLTPEEMGGILLRGKDLLKWYSDVEDEA
ncbi:MAG: DUF2800 domain-containing protein, partial [Clostridia bacterium]|nr:DUF2800 domain-containing protein [Clostridia bacterium]